MKYWMLLFCVVLLGCGSSSPSNIVENADEKALAEYEAAIAEADKMASEDPDFKD
jgi:hypothetical protein